MGLKFFLCAYMHLQITVRMRDYTHIAYIKFEKLLSDSLQSFIFIVK